MSMNSELNPPSTVGLHRKNYLTNISGDSPPTKKRKNEIIPLYKSSQARLPSPVVSSLLC